MNDNGMLVSQAVAWWVERLIRHHRANGSGVLDMVAIGHFIEHLALALPGELVTKRALERETVVLQSDYSPIELLMECADIAGLRRDAFPIKTTMWVGTNGVLSVRDGYQAEIEIIYSQVA